jgi:hypothetical protein
LNHPSDDELEHHRREIRALAAALPARPLQARTAPPARPAAAADGIDRARRAYAIGELTDPHHRAFVDGAFRALLKRAPAPDETEAQLRLLGRGTSKAEILGNLRWSAEGRRGNVWVHGLLPRYVAAKARRIPLLGTLLDWLLALAALPLLARHQRATDAMVAAGQEAAAARLDALASQEALLRQRIDDLHAVAHQLVVARDALTRSLADVETALRSRVEDLEGRAHAMAAQVEDMAGLGQRLRAVNHWSHHLAESFTRIETLAAQQEAQVAGVAAASALRAAAEDPARGTHYQRWLDAFVPAFPPGATVLVLAGGAEWCSGLASRGADVVLAEADPALADAARATGACSVETVRTEELLQRMADASLDAVAVLALPVLLARSPLPRLLSELWRCLRPGAPVLVAWSREAALLLQAQVSAAPPAPDAALVASALAEAGFAAMQRVDAADGTPALLARRAPA